MCACVCCAFVGLDNKRHYRYVMRMSPSSYKQHAGYRLVRRTEHNLLSPGWCYSPKAVAYCDAGFKELNKDKINISDKNTENERWTRNTEIITQTRSLQKRRIPTPVSKVTSLILLQKIKHCKDRLNNNSSRERSFLA